MDKKKPVTSMTIAAKKAPGSMSPSVLQAGDELFVVFDTPVALLGGPQARGFINLIGLPIKVRALAAK